MTRLLCLVGSVVAASGAVMVPGADAPRPSITNSLGMEFIQIPTGRFVMGSAGMEEGDDDEQPPHEVVIPLPLFVGRYEVTQDEYRRVMGENPAWFAPDGPGQATVEVQDTSRHPVDRVTWEEATEFCQRLSARAEEQRAGRAYRLPTEAEWEYACRAGTTTAFNTGDTLRANQACFRLSGKQASLSTRPVGSYQPNDWGLYDIHGNVWEWCADHYRFDAYRTASNENPQGPTNGTGRVVRGGAWNFGAEHCRSANRDFTRQTRRDVGNGFRVICVMP